MDPTNNHHFSNHIHKLFDISKSLRKQRLGYATNAYPVETSITSEDSRILQTKEAHCLVEEFMTLTNWHIGILLLKKFGSCTPLRSQLFPSQDGCEEWKIKHGYIPHILMHLQHKPIDFEGNCIHISNAPVKRYTSIISLQTSVWNDIVEAIEWRNLTKAQQLIGADELHPQQCFAYRDWISFQESGKYVCSDLPVDAHYSLGIAPYVTFTSPIRRYIDTVAHRLVHALLADAEAPYTTDEIMDHCHRQNRATERSKAYQKQCKLIYFAHELRKKPKNFVGFVEELSNKSVFLHIPGLKEIPRSNRELKFNMLDVSSIPKVQEDKDWTVPIGTTRECVEVTWQKRLYNKEGKAPEGAKPGVGNIDPNQATTTIQYNHWLMLLKESMAGKTENLHKVVNQPDLVPNYVKDFAHWEAKITPDVNSEQKTKGRLIQKHLTWFKMWFHLTQPVCVQLGAEAKSGLLVPTLQLLDMTKTLSFCLQHARDPVKHLAKYTSSPTKAKYRSVHQYLEIWLPILEMESITNAMRNEDSATISNVEIKFNDQKEGTLCLGTAFCEVRNIDFGDRKLDGFELNDDGNDNDDGDTNNDVNNPPTNLDDDDAVDIADVAGVEDSRICHEMISSDKAHIICNEINNAKIENKMLRIRHDHESHENKVTTKRRNSKDDTLKTTNYVCIRCPSETIHRKRHRQIVAAATGERNFWVGHATMTHVKAIDSQHPQFPDKKFHSHEVRIKLNDQCVIPPPKKEIKASDNCTMEILMKSTVDRRIETVLKCLGESQLDVTDLSKAIALGVERNFKNELDGSHHSVEKDFQRDVKIPELDIIGNNPQQKIAINNALTRQFSLIQGPPGTGKSHTAMKLIYLFDLFNTRLQVKDASLLKKKVIFCGPSNKSVDLVARWVFNKLGEYAPKMIRLYGHAYERLDFPVPGQASGSQRSLRDARPDRLLTERGLVLHDVIRTEGNLHAEDISKYDKLFKEHPEEVTLKEVRQYKDLIKKASIAEIKKYDVIFCTTTLTASPRILRATSGIVKQLIIDECGMCTDPECMVPIIATRAEQVVLIGDHKQLQPIVLNRDAAQLGLNTSLFERYAKLPKTGDSYITMLTRQYRMNPKICQFPSDQFYDGKLKTGLKSVFWTVDKPLKLWRNPSPQTHTPLAFIHVVGEEEVLTVTTEEGNDRSVSNLKEAKYVARLFDHLVSNEGVDVKSIQIMTQYNAQRHVIQEVLKERKFINIKVNTVVSSQGGEWDYVIFSTVRSLPEYLIEPSPTQGWCRQNLGFITDKHQINVALTRARKGLIIVGNKILMRTDEVWGALIKHYSSIQCMYTPETFPPTPSSQSSSQQTGNSKRYSKNQRRKMRKRQNQDIPE